MGRVEKNEDMERRLERMKGEMVQAVRKGGKRSAAPACLGLLFLACLLAGALAVSLATGIVTVPQALKDWYQQQRV